MDIVFFAMSIRISSYEYTTWSLKFQPHRIKGVLKSPPIFPVKLKTNANIDNSRNFMLFGNFKAVIINSY